MAALVQQLDHYSKVGIPKVQHQDYQSPFPFPEDEVEEGESVGHTNRQLRGHSQMTSAKFSGF